MRKKKQIPGWKVRSRMKKNGTSYLLNKKKYKIKWTVTGMLTWEFIGSLESALGWIF